MVNRQQHHSGRRPANQGVRDVIPEPNKIGASTPYEGGVYQGMESCPAVPTETSKSMAVDDFRSPVVHQWVV
jgi:hypothetical protein